MHDEHEPQSAEQEPEPNFGGEVFAVADTPYCVWDWGLQERNLEYLESLDPAYFEHVGRVNSASLESDDPNERQRAATAIRLAYHHGLESLFALVFAAVQAPCCVVGWMQMYTHAKLRKLVRAASLPRNRDEWEEARAYREQILPYVWMEPRELSWEGISKKLIRPIGDEAHVQQIQERFAKLWSRFARDFTNEAFVDEYNSIKHGLRTAPGGFYLQIGFEGDSGEPASAERMHPLGGSDYGSAFFVRRTLIEDQAEGEKRAGPGDHHFRVRRKHLNWDPTGLCTALSLIYFSIHNVRGYLQARNGVDTRGLKFMLPPKEAIGELLGQTPGATSFDMDSSVLKSFARPFGKAELKRMIAERTKTSRVNPDAASLSEDA